jgi:hypothetical protein
MHARVALASMPPRLLEDGNGYFMNPRLVFAKAARFGNT